MPYGIFTRSASRSRTRSAPQRRCPRESWGGRISARSSPAVPPTSLSSTIAWRSSTCSAQARRVSWLESELREQPAALATLLDREADHAREVAAAFRRDDIRYIVIASRGSSSNAARYAQYLLGRANRVPVMFATPSLYTIYEQPPRLDGAIVIGISQSGASPDVASVLAEARRQGRPTIALTNDASSPLAQQADALLPLDAGEERAVAATKTYLNSIGAVALLFAAISQDDVALDELKRMPEILDRQIALSLETGPPLDEYRSSVGATTVARGVNYGTCLLYTSP